MNREILFFKNCCLLARGIKVFSDFCKFFLVNIYLVNVDSRNTRKRCEICSRLMIKTVTRTSLCFWLSLTFNVFHTFFIVSIADFEQVNVSCVP